MDRQKTAVRKDVADSRAMYGDFCMIRDVDET